MKTLAIIVGVLTITTVVYGFNREKWQQFNDDLAICNKELGVPPTKVTGKSHLCAIEKYDDLIGKDGLLSVENSNQAIKDFISDPAKLELALKILKECSDKYMQDKSTNQKKIAKMAECTLPIMALHHQDVEMQSK